MKFFNEKLELKTNSKTISEEYIRPKYFLYFRPLWEKWCWRRQGPLGPGPWRKGLTVTRYLENDNNHPHMCHSRKGTVAWERAVRVVQHPAHPRDSTDVSRRFFFNWQYENLTCVALLVTLTYNYTGGYAWWQEKTDFWAVHFSLVKFYFL